MHPRRPLLTRASAGIALTFVLAVSASTAAAAATGATGFTGAVRPRVSPAGTTLHAAGGGCPDAQVELRVRAAAKDPYDVPGEYHVRYLPTGPDGLWSDTFPMPPGPATVVAACFDEQITLGTIAPAPVGGHYPAPPREGGDFVVTALDLAEVFGVDGTPVPVVHDQQGHAHFADHDLPARVVAVGTLYFGELAGAYQTSTVGSATYDIPLSAQSPARGAATPRAAAAAPKPTAPSLAATGGRVPAGRVVVVALLLVLGGSVLLRRGRRAGA